MRRQQSRDVGLHALLDLGTQQQAPVIEQVVIDIRRPVFGGARITDQQHLSAFFQPFELAFLEPVIDAGAMTATEAVSLPVEPGCTVLRAQAGQAMTEKPGSQALEQWHLGQGTKFWGKIRGVLRHADGLQGVRLLRAMVSAFAVEF